MSERLFEVEPVLHPWQQSSRTGPRVRWLLEPSPGQAHEFSTDTERKAAAMVAPRTGTLRAAILDALSACPQGLTTWELHERIGGLLYSIAPRVPELVKAGWVQDSQRRRITPSGALAIVWVLSDKGKERNP